MVSKGIHIALYSEVDGVKFVFQVKLSRKRNYRIVKYLYKWKVDPPWREALEDPIVLTEVQEGKEIEPEDMVNGVEWDKPLEPEDI